MRLKGFKIENFRNLKLAEARELPNFIVICGGNGSVKSALLEALMTAKEAMGSYYNFRVDSSYVAAKAEKARIMLHIEMSDKDKQFAEKEFGQECPNEKKLIIEISKNGNVQHIQSDGSIARLFRTYSSDSDGPGFFDFITAHRTMPKSELKTWNTDLISDEKTKQTLANTNNKFQNTKQYLTSLKMQDLQNIQASMREGEAKKSDSLKEIRDIFDDFFSPMKFKDVHIDKSPFKFEIETAQGEIDIDDLSSGEKEIFNIFVRFHQLNPESSIILFDEADAHLHPDLERRYLESLKEITKENQLVLTTHSPEMMVAAGSENLFTVLKQYSEDQGNQFVKVTEDSHRHEILSELMGSRGLVSFNQRIVFIEGDEASADRGIYEKFYPPSEYNISFIPAGNSSTVRKISGQVNELLTSSTGFQQYFSIVDGDMQRSEEDPTNGNRLFKLPVYHVENFLIDESIILEATKKMLSDSCPFDNSNQVQQKLKELLFVDTHLKPFTRAVLESKVAKTAQQAYDAVYQNIDVSELDIRNHEFHKTEGEAKEILQQAVKDATWKKRCRGRALLKAYCSELNINYIHFRNLLISQLNEPPMGLQNIFDEIID
jgi:AAA15 family ATPase/GTPase